MSKGKVELVAEVAAVRLVGPNAKKVSGRSGYLKLRVGNFAHKTETSTFEPFFTSLEEVCSFPICKEEVKAESVLMVAVKVFATQSLLKLKPTRSKVTAGTAHIRVEEVAGVGSPLNVGTFTIYSDEDGSKLGEVDLALYWARLDKREAPMTYSATRQFTKPLSKSSTSDKVQGLSDLRKSLSWRDNFGGIADMKDFSSLRIAVLEAKGLRAADTNGLSDPFCIISCRGSKFKTATIKKTLEPKWGEVFQFPSREFFDRDDEINIQVRDSDIVSRDDDLGEVFIPLWVFLDSNARSEAQWFDLEPTGRMETFWNRKKSLGSIRIQVDFKERAPSLTHSSSFASSLDLFRRTRLRASLNGKETIEEVVATNKPSYYVKVVQARNLASADANGFSDPYCKLSVLNESHRTRTVKKNLHPKWNQTFHFGMHDYIGDTDVLRITLYDKDFGVLEGVSDDKLGEVEIPMFVLRHQQAPEWYALKSRRYSFAGEIQLAIIYVPPTSHLKDDQARAMYKGKEWLYELQVTLMNASHLPLRGNRNVATFSPFCILQCGSGKPLRSKSQKRTRHPVWNEKFTFKDSIDESRQGLGRMDNLRIHVFGSERDPVGKLDLSLGDILDKLGYVDKQGESVTSEFTLEPLDGQELEAMEDDDEGATETNEYPAQISSPKTAVANGESGRSLFSSIPSPSLIRKKVFSFGRKSSMSPQNSVQIKSSDDEEDGATDDDVKDNIVSRRSYDSTESQNSPLFRSALSALKRTVKEKEDAMKSKVQHLSEQTKQSSALIAARLNLEQKDRDAEEDDDELEEKGKDNDENCGRVTLRLLLRPVGELRMVKSNKIVARMTKLKQMSFSQPPAILYSRLTMGLNSQEGGEVRFHKHSGGISNFTSLFVFESVQDVLIELDKKRKASRGGRMIESANLRLEVFDGETDRCIAEASLETVDIANMVKSEDPAWIQLDSKLPCETSPMVQLQLSNVTVDEEMKPKIGYFHLNLISLKVKGDHFEYTYRTVVRYKDQVITASASSGALSVKFEKSRHHYTFAVHDMFSMVEIQLWRRKVAEGANAPDGDTDLVRSRQTSKWGAVVGSCTVSVFDLLELEARMVHENKSLLDRSFWPQIKLPLTKNGKTKASIWVEAIYDEDVSAEVTPNPNPTLRQGKQFSMTNIRYEINRTVAILSWFGSVGGGISALLNWDNTAHTCFAILVSIVYCTSDIFSERILALPFYFLMFYIIKRHHDKMHGGTARFVRMESTRATKAAIKVSVVRARNLVDDSLFSLGAPHKLNVSRHVRGASGDSIPAIGEPTRESFAPDHTSSASDKRSRFRRMLSMAPTRKNIRAKAVEDTIENETQAAESNARKHRHSGSTESAPAARVNVFLTRKFGDKSFHIGTTRTSFPTAHPEFSSSKKGYFIPRKKGFKSSLIDWEYGPACSYPAFYFELDHEPLHTNMVVVRLYGARNLLGKDSNGLSDPFVVLHSSGPQGKGKEMKSKVRKETLNPTWNEEFILGANEYIQSSDSIEFHVWDADRLTDERIGSWKVSVASILEEFGGEGTPQWVQLRTAEEEQDNSPGSAGELFLSVWLLDFSRCNAGQKLLDSYAYLPSQLLGEVGTQPSLLGAGGNSFRAHKPKTEEQERSNPDSWYRSSSEIVFEIENTASRHSRRFWGMGRVPVAALISNEDRLRQKTFEQWVPLLPRLDGSRADSYLEEYWRRDENGTFLGEVLVRVELELPDPKAKEKMMELEEAKRAENGGAIATLRMINKRLEALQTTLYTFNNKMEHIKNLFNWSHPRKTDLVLRLVIFLTVLFTLVPSRYIVMFVMLFMFTERFRPLGTMGLRFNHLLALLPTDDDLRTACSGDVVEAKRRMTSAEGSEDLDKNPAWPPVLCIGPHSLEVVQKFCAEAKTWNPHRQPKTSTAELSAEDLEEGFGSHLRVLTFVSKTFSGSRSKWLSFFFFFVPKDGTLFIWPSREAFESNQPAIRHESNIIGVETTLNDEKLYGCEMRDCAFAIICFKSQYVSGLSSMLRQIGAVTPRSVSPRSGGSPRHHRVLSDTCEPSYLASAGQAIPLSNGRSLSADMRDETMNDCTRLILVASSKEKKESWIKAISQSQFVK